MLSNLQILPINTVGGGMFGQEEPVVLPNKCCLLRTMQGEVGLLVSKALVATSFRHRKLKIKGIFNPNNSLDKGTSCSK